LSRHPWFFGFSARRALPSPGLTAPLSERTTLGVQAMGTNNLMHVPGPLTREQAESDPAQANATYRARDERRYNRLGRIAITLDHAPDAATGVSGTMFVAPKHLQRSERGTFRDFTRYHFGGHVIGSTGQHREHRGQVFLRAHGERTDPKRSPKRSPNAPYCVGGCRTDMARTPCTPRAVTVTCTFPARTPRNFTVEPEVVSPGAS
jgi:hypothetical protein